MSKNEYLNKKTKNDKNLKTEGKGDSIMKEKENEEEIITYNIIVGKIKIKINNLKQRIINSYENFKANNHDEIKGVENEKEIKACEIFINDEKIDFTYFYKFPKKGEYIIKYIFKNLLNSTNYMFSDCDSLISLDLSNFNTQNITNMTGMFNYCNSLISLNLTNFNTQNITNMAGLFFNCNSLKSLDLSNFNTEKVTKMDYMFSYCNSLISLDLSNFNIKKVTKMNYMFSYCNSLTLLDLPNFDIQNVNKENIFNKCNSLIINLSIKDLI